jgi:hypothetical protein
VIRKVIDRVHSIVSTNFNGDFSTLASAAGVPALTLAAGDFFKRLAAEVFAQKVAVGIGYYQDGGATQAKRPGAALSGIRDTTVVVVIDWYLSGDNPDDVAVQTEVALDALLRSIDRMLEPDANGVRAAGAERGSIVWEITRTPLIDDSRIATERAKLRVPFTVRDTGL